jgi:hypothetical protein
MVNNKLTFQFSATYEFGNIIVKCYHSRNKIIIGVSNVTNYIEFEKLHDPYYEVLSWASLEHYLSYFPTHKKVSYEMFLHMFNAK